MKRSFVIFLSVILLFAGCAKISVAPGSSITETNDPGETLLAAGQPITENKTARIDDEEVSAETFLSETLQNKTEFLTDSSTFPSAEITQPAPVSAVRPTAVTAPSAAVSQTASAPAATVTEAAARNETPRPATSAASESRVTASTAPATKQAVNTCVIRIECKTIQNNLKKLKAGKNTFLPSNGIVLDDTVIELQPDDSAFSVLQRACRNNVCTDNCQYCQRDGIQLEYTFAPGFNTYYVEGIHQIYEKDCGTMSGWMFSVNGQFPEEGASGIKVRPGDRIVFCFTCDMGDDVGNHFDG